MNDVLVAHRFQRLVPLHAGGDLRLDLARDVASDTLGSLLTVGPKVESAGELSLRVRLKFFEGGPLFRPMLPLTVVRSAEGLHLLLPPIEAHPWESQLLAAEGALAVGDLRIILDGLKRHEDAGCPAGGLKLDMLYRDEQGPFFLPLAYVLPSPSSFSYHDRLLCRQESRELREELGGLCRRYLKMAGGRLSGEQRRQVELIQAELVAEEPEPPAPRPLRPLVQTLEALREEGGALIVKGGARSLHEAAEVITAWARISERRLAILRPHVCSPVQRYRRGGGQEHGPVILLRNYSSYAPFAQSLQYLRSMDWLSQREIVVVLVEASTSGEASRLFLEGLRGKGSERGFEWNLPGDGSPSAPKQEAGEGLAGRILEALQVARRPLSGEFLRRAFSIREDELAEAVGELHERRRAECLYGMADDGGPQRQLLLTLPWDARIEVAADREKEISGLLSSTLGSLKGRPGWGRLWLDLESALDHDPPRAPGLVRQIAEQCEKEGERLLPYAAYERLLATREGRARSKLEDRGRAALIMGEVHSELGETERALGILQGALQEVEEEGAPASGKLVQLAVDLTLALTAIQTDRGDYLEINDLVRASLEKYEEDLSALPRCRLYLDLSWALFRLGRTREAARYSELVLRILDAERHPLEVAKAYNQLGLLQYEESNYQQSLINLERALVLREQAGDSIAVARSYNNLSLTYRSLGRLLEAERCLKRSLTVKIKAGDTVGVANAQLNLGLLAIVQGDPEKARACAAECLHAARSCGSLRSEAEAHGLLGEAAMEEGKWEEARDYLLRDLEICRSIHHDTERLATLRRLLRAQIKLGELDEVRQRLAEARELLGTVPSRFEGSMLDIYEAGLLRDDGKLEEALELLAKAARNFGAIHRFDLQVDALARKAELEWEMGEVSKTRATLRQAREIAVRQEIHRFPQRFLDLESRVGEIPENVSVPEGVDRHLEAIADLLSPGGDLQGRRIEGVLRAVAATLGVPEVHLVRPSPQDTIGLVRATIERDCVPEGLEEVLSQLKSESTGGLVSRSPWVVLRLWASGEEWLCLRCERELDDKEQVFLTAVAGLLSLSGEASITPPLQNLIKEPDAQPGAAYGIIGTSPEIVGVLRMIEMVKDNDVTILILGENGTGKDLVARAIHNAGWRSKREFVAVNCASIPSSLLESELFGHEKGAFTSAVDRRIGIFERAEGGSVFLDEIAEMPLAMQAKLLRVLQDKTFTRVGGSKTIHSDVRLIAATNRDLSREVEQGRFRMDLFYRLNVITIHLPPLREHKEDIRPLVHHFLHSFSEEFRRPVRGITDEAIERLMEYDWPGNIRELENVIKKAIVFAGRDLLRVEDMPRLGAGQPSVRPRAGLPETVRSLVEGQDYSEERPLMPRLELELAWELVQAVGNKTKAARLLGITKPTLYNRLRRYEELNPSRRSPRSRKRMESGA